MQSIIPVSVILLCFRVSEVDSNRSVLKRKRASESYDTAYRKRARCALVMQRGRAARLFTTSQVSRRQCWALNAAMVL